MAVTGGGDNNDPRPVGIDSRPTLYSSEDESTCPSPCQSCNKTSFETIANVLSGYVEPQSKSATTSIDLCSDDDAIEIETSEIVPKS